ncbi:phenylalanine--tRNA ligase subunit alpha [Candidatus Parcubacteria bacterium]|nr:phenylalanine--tRNA ligase subunit alpha [Patescibacteria group bacterium]MCG2694448.1 phenylalanine--tRNA ligase subunit alpha [Candidatus Parcubacteria bacterium]
MKDKLKQLKKSALVDLEKAKNIESLQDFEVRYFGRKGIYTLLVKDLPKLSVEDRKEMGRAANEIKTEIQEAIKTRQTELQAERLGNIAKEEWIDKTLPGLCPEVGHLHITSQAIEEIASIFTRLGFVRRKYPEIEWDWYAFESLNMPASHPARDEWETFFIDLPEGKPRQGRGEKGKIVLTPHTSSGQVREMERGKLPIRMMNISKTYRRQSDVSHTPMFHQFEGLFIDEDVSIASLKGVLDYFARSFFGEGRRTRLRPFHFRFTEPSFEIDISCDVCGGTGKLEDGSKCRLCKEGWLELGGAGMIHPNVLKAGGIDPKKYNGFAFGWGVERTFMMKEGMKIDDIRLLYKNDLRFLEQF